MLCLFLEFPVSVFHHPVHELLSRPSSSPLPLQSSHHYLSLQRVTSQNVSSQVFFCLVLTLSINDLFSSTFFNISSIALCSVQLILSIFLLTSCFLIVHVSTYRSIQRDAA